MQWNQSQKGSFSSNIHLVRMWSCGRERIAHMSSCGRTHIVSDNLKSGFSKKVPSVAEL